MFEILIGMKSQFHWNYRKKEKVNFSPRDYYSDKSGRGYYVPRNKLVISIYQIATSQTVLQAFMSVLSPAVTKVS